MVVQKIQKLKPIDDAFFQKLMENKEVCEEMLRVILEDGEFVLEKMEEENLSVRRLAKKAHVSPTVIQKLRNTETSDHISYKTFLDVIDCLGYKVSLQRKESL